MSWQKLRLDGVVRLADGGARESTNESCGVGDESRERGLKRAGEHDCICIRSEALEGRAGWIAGILRVCRGLEASMRCVGVGTLSRFG